MGYQTILYWRRDVVRQPLVVWYPMGVRERFWVGGDWGMGGFSFVVVCVYGGSEHR